MHNRTIPQQLWTVKLNKEIEKKEEEEEDDEEKTWNKHSSFFDSPFFLLLLLLFLHLLLLSFFFLSSFFLQSCLVILLRLPRLHLPLVRVCVSLSFECGSVRFTPTQHSQPNRRQPWCNHSWHQRLLLLSWMKEEEVSVFCTRARSPRCLNMKQKLKKLCLFRCLSRRCVTIMRSRASGAANITRPRVSCWQSAVASGCHAACAMTSCTQTTQWTDMPPSKWHAWLAGPCSQLLRLAAIHAVLCRFWAVRWIRIFDDFLRTFFSLFFSSDVFVLLQHLPPLGEQSQQIHLPLCGLQDLPDWQGPWNWLLPLPNLRCVYVPQGQGSQMRRKVARIRLPHLWRIHVHLPEISDLFGERLPSLWEKCLYVFLISYHSDAAMPSTKNARNRTRGFPYNVRCV